jgi:putative ABC transport system ATP-binding protein
MSGPVLVAKGLCKRFPSGRGAVDAVADVDLVVPAGEVVAIRGASGSGKSTLLHLLATLLPPDLGTVRIDGEAAARHRAAAARRRRAQLGIALQRPALLPHLDVEENIGLAVGGVDERTRQLVDRLGLDARRHQRPPVLSGGEQQRVAVARMLVREPLLLLADEPTASLDERNERVVMECLREAADRGAAVVVVSHARRVWGGADRILTMDGGRLGAGAR